MNRNSLRPMYDQLTGEERFRLALQSAASGDDSEATHLMGSCPRVEGSAVDPAFSNPLMASHRLASAFSRMAGPLFGWLNLVGALESILTGESGRKHLQLQSQFRVTWVLDLAAQEAALRLRALVDAFEEVCSERANLPGAVLLCVWAQEAMSNLEEAQTWIQELEADAATREECKETLDQAWTLD